MNLDLTEQIKTVVEPLLETKEALMIRRLDKTDELENKDQNYLIVVANNDLVKIISNHGQTANAIRQIIGQIGRNNHKRVSIKFEALTDKE